MLYLKEKNENQTCEVYFYLGKILPQKLLTEIERIGITRFDFPSSLSEITLRASGMSSLVIAGENIPLFTRLNENDISKVFESVTESSVYAHKNDILSGFITLPHGIRVGICAALSNNGAAISRVCSMVFRIPIGKCGFADELFDVWMANSSRGMLIYSLPGAGKTSALRAICGIISRRLLKKVVIVDERCEFSASDYFDATVDILSGYPKAVGIEMALRTLSAELIVVDEIGSSDEAESLLRVGRGGVPIIASAHAGSYGELVRKCGISRLVEEEYFSSFVRLFRNGSSFGYEVS